MGLGWLIDRESKCFCMSVAIEQAIVYAPVLRTGIYSTNVPPFAKYPPNQTALIGISGARTGPP